MKTARLNEIIDISKTFIGEENNQPKSVVVLYMSSLNPKTNEESALSICTSIVAKSNIKFIKDKAIVDIFFTNPLLDDCKNLIANMELYKILLGQNEEYIINKISFVLNDELKSQQLLFVNPIYFTKFANRAGGKINGVRLFYDVKDILYIPEFFTKEDLDEINEFKNIEEDDE